MHKLKWGKTGNSIKFLKKGLTKLLFSRINKRKDIYNHQTYKIVVPGGTEQRTEDDL